MELSSYIFTEEEYVNIIVYFKYHIYNRAKDIKEVYNLTIQKIDFIIDSYLNTKPNYRGKVLWVGNANNNKIIDKYKGVL